jgi:hypothetical protein
MARGILCRPSSVPTWDTIVPAVAGRSTTQVCARRTGRRGSPILVGLFPTANRPSTDISEPLNVTTCHTGAARVGVVQVLSA